MLLRSFTQVLMVGFSVGRGDDGVSTSLPALMPHQQNTGEADTISAGVLGCLFFNFWRHIPRMRSGFQDIEKEYIPRTSFCIPTFLSVVLTAEQTSGQGHRWPHRGPTCRAQQLPCLRRAANFQASQRACPLPPFPGNEHTRVKTLGSAFGYSKNVLSC